MLINLFSDIMLLSTTNLLLNTSKGCQQLRRSFPVQRLMLRNLSAFSLSYQERNLSKRLNSQTLIKENYVELLPWNIYSKRSFSHITFLQSVAQSQPVQFVQDSLLYFHDVSHLPWWTVIVLTTVGVRFLLTFPLTVYQSTVLAKYANLQPEIKQLVGELKMETARAVKLYNWDEKTAKKAFYKSLRKHRQNLIVRENCHPFKASLVIWVQIPMWIFISFAIRNLVFGANYPDAFMQFLNLATEGAVWFSNLTIPDPYFVLPVLLGVVNLAIVEFHALKASKPNKFQKAFTWFFRGFSVVMVPIAATVPSCLALYWFTSSCVGLLQNVILTSPNVRQMCKIPRVQGDSLTPYTDLWNKLKNRRITRK